MTWCARDFSVSTNRRNIHHCMVLIAGAFQRRHDALQSHKTQKLQKSSESSLGVSCSSQVASAGRLTSATQANYLSGPCLVWQQSPQNRCSSKLTPHCRRNAFAPPCKCRCCSPTQSLVWFGACKRPGSHHFETLTYVTLTQSITSDRSAAFAERSALC